MSNILLLLTKHPIKITDILSKLPIYGNKFFSIKVGIGVAKILIQINKKNNSRRWL